MATEGEELFLFFDGGPKKTTPSFHDPFKKTNIAEAHGDGRSEMVRASGVFFFENWLSVGELLGEFGFDRGVGELWWSLFSVVFQ